MNKYDVLEYISKGESGTLSPENEELVRVANDIRRAISSSRDDEEKCCSGVNNAIEERIAEQYAKVILFF